MLGFDFCTSLNFSIYLDQPRMEHLVNIKRTWLTVAQIRRIAALIPIPHLQWATLPDLQRQLDYAQGQGVHTLTLNLQMVKRQGRDAIAPGFPLIREQAPDLRFLFSGVVSLKRMQELAVMFPHASFTNTTAHYLALRYVRLQRDGTRLIKEPVDGHPDLILGQNVSLYRAFLAEVQGEASQPARSTVSSGPDSEEGLQPTVEEIIAALQEQLGYAPQAAGDVCNLLCEDEAVLEAFWAWLEHGELDRDFRGSFSTWPCSECVPHPSLGELLDQGAEPLDAFLHLAHLAGRVNEEIAGFIGQAGY